MKQQNICPCCGHALNAKAARQIVAEIGLGTNTRKIVDDLVAHFGMWRTRQELADAAYADDPDGGPDTAIACVSNFISDARPKLARRGLIIEGKCHHGMRMVWAKP